MLRKSLYLLLSLSIFGIALTIGMKLIGTNENKVFAQQQQQISNDTELIIKAGPLTAVRHVYDDPKLRLIH